MDMKLPVHMPLSEIMENKALDTTRSVRKAEDGRLREACQGFEEIFINMMLKEMRKAMPKGGLFPDSIQKDIYQSMFDQHVAHIVSTGKGIGLSDMFFENLSKRPT